MLEPRRSTRALISIWATLAALILGFRFLVPSGWQPYLYVPIIFLIAGRFGALLQLIHEGAHGLLSHSKKMNFFISRWLCAYPIGVFFDGYQRGHLRHHAGTNTKIDPPADTEKYRITDFRSPKLYLLLLKDVLGLTAFEIFFAYKQTEESATNVTANESAKDSKVGTLFCLMVCNLVVLGVLFQFQIVPYVLLWLIPAVSPHMFLMRIRGIAEHGLSKQLGVEVTEGWRGNFYTRSFFTKRCHYSFPPMVWLERILIGSLSVNHHHEHHLMPTVPFYHLSKVHDRIAPELSRLNPDVYAAGYFAAAVRNLLEPVPAAGLEGAHV